MIEQKRATPPGYGIVAKSFHWLILVLLIAQYAIAWTMPHIGRGTQPGTLINLHLAIGVLVLALALARLAWRLVYPVPLIPDDTPRWQVRAAEALHGLLYLLIFATPISGWAAASMRGWPVDFFGLFNFPPWLAPSSLAGPVGDLHTLCTDILLGAVGLHVLAALYHQLVLRDRVLLRMLPGSATALAGKRA